MQSYKDFNFTELNSFNISILCFKKQSQQIAELSIKTFTSGFFPLSDLKLSLSSAHRLMTSDCARPAKGCGFIFVDWGSPTRGESALIEKGKLVIAYTIVLECVTAPDFNSQTYFYITSFKTHE